MENKLAHIISVVFFPLFLPAYTLLIFFYYNNFSTYLIPNNIKYLVFTLVIISTCFFPVLFIYIMKRKGMINSVRMETQNERVFPLIITIIFFFMAFYMLRDIEFLGLFHYFLIGSAVLTVIALLINFITKISIHMIGMGGLTGTLIGLSLRVNIDLLVLINLSVFLSGLTAYARLKLKAHNQFQIYSGFLLGLLAMWIVFMI